MLFGPHPVEVLEMLPTPRHGTPTRAWAGSVHHDARRGISSLRFGSLAVDATRAAIESVGEVLPQCQAVVYADVPIADRRASHLLDLLQERGFCFGALLPGTAASEAIRMQRLSGRVSRVGNRDGLARGARVASVDLT